MKITVIGASGFIGRHLVDALRARGDEIVTTSLRDPSVAAKASDGSDAIVNLAGEAVAQRWTPQVRERIRRSRVDAVHALVAALGAVVKRPAAYISASAVGYYGTSEDATFDENSPPGSDFLADVCVAWEGAADRAALLGMRVAKVRTGLVLGTDGGALAKLLPIFKLGAGGVVASGRQWYSWIHIDDQVAIYLQALGGVDGVLNATAPNPVRNRDFTRALAATLHRPAILPVPALAVGALLGDAAAVVTQGQRVLPARTIERGYRFKYETVDSALRALLA